MSNTWFRMYYEFATDHKIQMLSEVDQRRYVMLLCFKCGNDNVTLHDNEIAFQLRVTEADWNDTKKRLIEKNLITDDNQPTGWDKRQFTSDSSAERVRRHRERKKKECNVTVTPPDTDTDTDTDTDIYIRENSDEPESFHDDFFDEKIIPIGKPPRKSVPVKKIVDLYHEILPELPRFEKLTKTREGLIRQRWLEDLPDLEEWREYFEYIRASPFLMGKIDPGPGKKIFRADLEWITRPSNFAKIAERKYHG